MAKEMSFAAAYQENQKHRPKILFLEWDGIAEQWIYDTWSADEPNKKLVLLDYKDDDDNNKKIPKRVHDMLRGTDVKVTSDRGLVCFQYNNIFILCNPSTQKSIMLPQLNIPFEREGLKTCFLGFLPKKLFFFNLLCVTQRNDNSVQYHLLTMQNVWIWNRLDYQLEESHFPDKCNTSVCIDGIIYYGGHIENSPTLMKFDLKSKSFTLIQLSTELLQDLGNSLWDFTTLVAFHGKPALGRSMVFGNSLRLWTLDSSSSWTKNIISTEPLLQGIDTNDRYAVHFVGAAPCEEKLIFTIKEPFVKNSRDFVVYYNPMNDISVNRLPIKINTTQNSKFVWNHTSSFWFRHTRVWG